MGSVMQGKPHLGTRLGGCAAVQECGRAASLHGSHLFQCGQPGDAVNCSDKQYEHKGRCCNRCQPGKKLASECNDTEDSVCTPCENGQYQQSWTKERHCTPHEICEDNAGLIVKRHGNATHNTVCQCRAGMHCSDASCQTCVENEPCKQGFGFVAAMAEARMTSPCEPCAEGTFSNVSSKTEPCHFWTSCEEKGLVVKVKGTNTSDVICESSRRSSLSVLIPITAAVVTCLVGICIYCLVHTDLRRRGPKQVSRLQPWFGVPAGMVGMCGLQSKGYPRAAQWGTGTRGAQTGNPYGVRPLYCSGSKCRRIPWRGVAAGRGCDCCSCPRARSWP
uniref:Tumor necrosis factor receptor superfamily member 5 n=1 Tax=Gallus gallus TaxID=9031 RepID=A0A8V0YKH8_CHICK